MPFAFKKKDTVPYVRDTLMCTQAVWIYKAKNYYILLLVVLFYVMPKVEHAARGPKARPKARSFGPARARHGPILTGSGPARSTLRAVLGPTPRPAARHGTARF